MKGGRYYVLAEDGKTPVAVNDVSEWAERFERDKRAVCQHNFPDGTLVSTVFLGLDHSFFPDGPPLLFETMVFGAKDRERYCRRYSTWDEAFEGHMAVVRALEAGKDPEKDEDFP